MKREVPIPFVGMMIAALSFYADMDTLFGFGCGLCAGFGFAMLEVRKGR